MSEVEAEAGGGEVEETILIEEGELDTLVHTKPKRGKGKTSSTFRTTSEEEVEEVEAVATTHSSETTTKRIAKGSKRCVNRTSKAIIDNSEDVGEDTVVSLEAVVEVVASTINSMQRANRMNQHLLKRTPTSRSVPGVNSRRMSET